MTGVIEDSEGTANYILSGTWDERMESSKIVDSSQGCGGSEGKQKTVYQTLQPKLLWKKYPLPYVQPTLTHFCHILNVECLANSIVIFPVCHPLISDLLSYCVVFLVFQR